MKPNSQFFDDIARVATGAVGAMSGLREHIRDEVKTHVNRFIIEMDFVPREDFEVVEAMAKEARLQNKKLEARIAKLEKQAKPATKKTAPKKKVPANKTTRKTTSKTKKK